MAKQFTLYISHPDAQIEGHAELDLPARPYELRDALEKARIAEGKAILLEMDGWRCDELEDAFNHRARSLDTVKDIYVLNALAEKMSSMEQHELNIAGGLIRMEKHPDQIPIERFYDLMHSTECCHYVDTPNDVGLGKFYVENGFVPELENLPDSVVSKLDFKRIGQEMREAEGGVFLDEGLGYVVLHSDIIEAHKNLSPVPPEPDYAILLEVSKQDQGEPELLKLPLSPAELDSVLSRFEARDRRDLSWRCADCKIPSIRDTVSTADSVWQINSVAEMLDKLSGVELSTCKALLSVMKPGDLTDVMDQLAAKDEYVLSRDLASPADIGMSRLKTALQEDEVKLLAPHVNLYAYGQSALNLYGMELTEYGGLERWDGLPVLRKNDAPAQGGMEMM